MSRDSRVYSKRSFRGIFWSILPKFGELVLTRIRFVTAHWSSGQNEDLLCAIIPKMMETGGLPLKGAKEVFHLPRSWEAQIERRFDQLESSPFPENTVYGSNSAKYDDKCLPKYSALLRVLDCCTVQASTSSKIAHILLKKLKLSLRPSTLPITPEAQFIVTQAFEAYVKLTQIVDSIDPSLGPLLKAATCRFNKFPAFLDAMAQCERAVRSYADLKGIGSSSPQNNEDPWLICLIHNLTSPSSKLRLLSLRLLEQLHRSGDQFDSLSTMIQIEETPFDFQNCRMVTSVLMQRLLEAFLKLPAESWLARAIPAHFFGLLTARISPVSKAAVNYLGVIGESKNGEEAIESVAFEWLSTPSIRRVDKAVAASDTPHGRLTDFECTNITGIMDVAAASRNIQQNTSRVLLEEFERQQKAEPVRPQNARHHAIRVLSALPRLAENRSRRLVPHLLSWNGDMTILQSAEEEDHEEPERHNWSLGDRKALVGLFGKFTNPRVLYQSDRVYTALLTLLTNGDLEMQKLSLQGLLSWKKPEVIPYKESLELLLDESKFRNELTNLFQGDQMILPEHRKVIMPLILRLLYGRMVSKKGVHNNIRGARKAILRILNPEDLGSFLGLTIGKLRDVVTVDASGIREATFSHEALELRRQVGFLNMTQDIVTEMGPDVLAHTEKLLQPVLYCLFSAYRTFKRERDEAEAGDEKLSTSPTSQNVRKLAMRCLILLFRNAQSFNWKPFMEPIVREVISSRVEMLPIENAQGVSGLFQLLSAWASLPKSALGFSIDERLLPQLVQVLVIEKAKDEVKIFVLDILRSLIRSATLQTAESELSELVKAEVLDPQMENILIKVSGLLAKHTSLGWRLLEACIGFMVEAAVVVEESDSIQGLVDICVKILAQPSGITCPRIKSTTLLVIEKFIPASRLDDHPSLKWDLYRVVSSHFSYFKDMPNRNCLGRILSAFAAIEPQVEEVSGLCSSLNSVVESEIDIPDYDKRLSAFGEISRPRTVPFTANQWTPLLHNLIFYIKNDDEAGLLSMSSSDGLCRLVQDATLASNEEFTKFRKLLIDTLLADIYKGVRESSEIVVQGYLRVVRYLAKSAQNLPEVADLKALLSPEDLEESPASECITGKSIFDIHHIPSASRMLVLEKVAEENAKAELNSHNIGKLLIPLLENFIFDRPERVDDGGLGATASTVISSLAVSLEWSQYRAIFKKFIGYLQTKPEVPKRNLRLLDRFTDALVAAAKLRATPVAGSTQESSIHKRRRLARTMPAKDKLTEHILQLPPLFRHLHDKDESTVSERVPVGVTIVKLLQLLPETLRNQRLPGVLMDICHILRSKAWGSRQMARETLARISKILGPGGFGFILKELQTALKNGYQLHVRSYTLHSLLLNVVPEFKQGDLDSCLPSIVAVIMDDTFGMTGEEKDADDYVSKYVEVKRRKSQDTMELVARNASISRLIDLVRPLQSLLLENLNIRMVRKIDELLTRITTGLLQNPSAESQATLVFCYEVVQEVYNSQKTKCKVKIDPKLKRYLLQRGARKNNRGTTTKCAFKVARFALDILRALFKKYDSLRNGGNIQGFFPIIGDAVTDGQEEVKISALKLLAVVVKVPFKDNASDGIYKVALKEASSSISTSPSTGSKISQAALKLVAVVLRDRKDLLVKDTVIDTILKRLKDDLTESSHRHYSFNFLRCVMDRKIETAVVYDTLDHVGYIMVTNDDKDTRDLARGAFFQFLRDYPQKKNRWEKQIAFVVANLKYDREGGRLSVMEVIHLLLNKSANDFIQEIVSTCFLPLVFVLANDESEKCRLAAGELIKEIFQKADRQRINDFLSLARSWMNQSDKDRVLALGMSTLGFYFEASDPTFKDSKDVSLSLQCISDVLEHHREGMETHLLSKALAMVRVLIEKYPSRVLGLESTELWSHVFDCLSRVNSSVRFAVVELISIYLGDFARRSKNQSNKLPIEGSHGLTLDRGVVSQLVANFCRLLSEPEIGEPLALEASRVLMFLSAFLKFGTEVVEPDAHGEDSGEKREVVNGNYLLLHLAKVLRRETPPRATFLVGKMSSMDLLEALCKKLPAADIQSSIKTILLPLNNLTDRDIPTPYSPEELFGTKYEALKHKAASVMRQLQEKYGTADYMKKLIVVREMIREKRKTRLAKRSICEITEPEKYGAAKRKKHLREKTRRKVKGMKHKTRSQGL